MLIASQTKKKKIDFNSHIYKKDVGVWEHEIWQK